MPASQLTSAQRAYLRGQGQRLGDALKLGREGVSAAVVQELDRLLGAYELIKLRFVSADRDQREQLCDQVAAALGCECVGAVGHTALFFRRNPDPAQRRIDLP